MEKKSVKKNYLYNVTYQILLIILPLLTAPYISRVLGAESIGIYSYALSISAYFISFGSLGVDLYAQREIAYYQDDKKSYSKTFWEITILRLFTMAISIIIFYFTFASNGDYQIFFKILLIELIGKCFDISWFFKGLEDFKKIVLRNLVIKILSIIAIFTFVKTPSNLNLYFWIYVLSVILGNLSLWLYLPKYVCKIKISALKIFRHLKPTISLFIPQIAIQVYTLLDKTMIGAIYEDKSEVGYYEQGQKIINMLLTVITSLGTVMLPRIANFFANNKKNAVKSYMEKSFNFVFLLAFPMIFGIIAVAKDFVPIFFGPGYDKVIILMSIISPVLLFIGMSNVIGTQYLLPTKRQKEYTISVVTGSIVNLCINASLIWKYGALGASIGTIIAEFTVTLVQIIFVKDEFDFKKIFKSAINYIIASIIMFIICKLTSIIPVNDFVSLILQVASGIITYGLVLLIFKDEFVLNILKQLKEKIVYRRLTIKSQDFY